MSEQVQTNPARPGQKPLVRLCASGIMIALGTVMSMISIWKMPLGGRITPLSMLPICIIAIIYGTKWGLCTSFAYALVQLILDFASALSWGLSVPALVVCFFVDYLCAFTMLGFAGVFRKKGDFGAAAGVVLACVLRFVCHVISGSTVFAVWMPEEWSNPLLYAVAYNGTFMLPETILTAAATFALMKVSAIRQLITD